MPKPKTRSIFNFQLSIFNFTKLEAQGLHDAAQGGLHGVVLRQSGGGLAVAVALVDGLVLGQHAQKLQAIYDKVMVEEVKDEEEVSEEEKEEVEVKDEDEAEEVKTEEVEAEEAEEIVDDEDVKRILADAETVCQGMKRPQGDSKDGKFSRNQIERIMRTALKDGGFTQFGDASTLEGKALEIALTACAMQVRSKNNPIAKSNFKDGFDNRSARINEINRNFWSK
mgnify:CR=1 FL=1